MSEPKGKSIWLWLGCGCLGLIMLGGGAIGLTGFMAFRTAKRIEREMNDPESRAEKACTILGADRLPEAYEAEVAFSLPLGIMDLIVLRGPDERSFMFLKGRIGDHETIERYWQGEADLDDVLDGLNVINSRDLLAEERLQVGQTEIAMARFRGDVDVGRVDSHSGGGPGNVNTEFDIGQQREEDRIGAVLIPRCPESRKTRMAIWFAPDPDRATPADELDLSGTPADTEEVRRFLSGVDLCSG